MSHIPTHTQNMVAAANGWGWGGHLGEVVPSRAYLFDDDRVDREGWMVMISRR